MIIKVTADGIEEFSVDVRGDATSRRFLKDLKVLLRAVGMTDDGASVIDPAQLIAQWVVMAGAHVGNIDAVARVFGLNRGAFRARAISAAEKVEQSCVNAFYASEDSLSIKAPAFTYLSSGEVAVLFNLIGEHGTIDDGEIAQQFSITIDDVAEARQFAPK